MPKASSLEAKILGKIDADVELIAGKGGIFDVHADGKLVYSKRAQNNEFPDEERLVGELQAMKA
ncbi:MAG: Rdx family protein [Planctomycetes bacterium]|nr:Rdx family protein [Planctomycetota bacterium]